MIRLKCVKEGNKLRVKIISPGYSPDANCQFPRDIRVENREYLVPPEDIIFSEMRCKFFYRVKKNNIQVVSQKIEGLKVYGDDENDSEHLKECCVCMMDRSTEPDINFVIFAPCGHYCCCSKCAQKLSNCPICRAKVQQLVTKSQLQL